MSRPDLLRGEKGPRAPQQRRSLRRRDAILKAAIARFGKDGYERASIRGIAREADVATGAVYQFFRSKRHLLLVSMDALLERLEKLGPPTLSGRGELLSELEQFLAEAFQRERPFVGVYRAWQEAALIDASIAERDLEVRAWSTARVRTLLGLMARLPEARPGADLEILAELWDRFFWNLLANPPARRARAVKSIARMLYHDLFSDRTAD